jgi:hypothetical protein
MKRPMTAAESRLIKAAIKESSLDTGVSDDAHLHAFDRYTKAVKAVVKEREKK